MLDASGQHDRFDLGNGPCRHPMRTRRPIPQAGVALGIEAGNPTMRTLARYAHRLRNMSHRHPILTDPSDEQTPTRKRQTSIAVTHEDLRDVATAIPTASEVFVSDRRTVTNVPAEYT